MGRESCLTRRFAIVRAVLGAHQAWVVGGGGVKWIALIKVGWERGR